MRHIVNALLLREGKVLLARRAPHRAAYPDRWSFPGGHVEANETLDAALIRESREEIGVSPTRFALLDTIVDPNTDASDPATYHMHAVTAWTGGEPAMTGDEHTALEWFAFDIAAALPDLALEEYRPLLRVLGFT
jgi:8-oxo-dGTP pyrophosphatase MutT (NUDIX family)